MRTMTWADINKVTGGNVEANTCLETWAACLRAVDNIVDEGLWDADHILEATALNIRFCCDPFYRQHIHQLQLPALIATGIWELSVEWERDSELWKRQWADVLRHADAVFLGAVCLICRGWEAATEFYREFWTASYNDHVERHGEVK